MRHCTRCGNEYSGNELSDCLCPYCAENQNMLDDCERDGRRELADFQANQRERREYHER